MKRQLMVLLLALVMVLTVVACVACQETTYELTYAAGEGSVGGGTAPLAEKYAEGAQVTLKANMFTAPEGKEFDGWLVDGAKKAAGDKISMPAKALTVTAQWKAKEQSQPTQYALTYAAGEGSGTAPAAEQYVAGAEVTLKANMFTAPEGKEFDGWLVDGAKKAAGDKISMPAKALTVTAQWKVTVPPQPTEWTLTFKVGEETVATVNIEDGDVIEQEQIPVCPVDKIPAGNGFVAWVDASEQEIEAGSEVTANATYTAKFEVNSWVVTFVNGQSEVKAYVLKSGNGKIAAADIPQAPAAPQDKVFLGWYNGVVKAQDATVSADTTFTAAFVGASDYVGAWYNDDTKVAVFVPSNISDGTRTNVTKKAFDISKKWGSSFNSENGTYVITIRYDNSRVDDTVTLSLINGQLAVEYKSFDGEEWEVTNYVLAKSTGATLSLNSKENSELLDIQDGLILNYNATGTFYGRIIEDDGEYSLIVYQNVNSSIEEKDIVIDSNNTWIIDGKMYFAASTANRVSYDYDPAEGAREYLVLYTIGQTTHAVYRKAGVDAYVTIQGTVAEGEIITIKFADNKELTVKVSNGKLLDKGAEAGTYTCADKSDITLDGFGTATIGSEKLAYTLVGDLVTIGDKFYTINVENKTYTAKEPIGYEGTYVFINENETPKRYFVIVLDGYGVAQTGNKGGSRPTDLASGTYTVNGNIITLAGFVSGFNGNYEAVEDGKALVYHGTATGTLKNQALVKDGETITSRFDEFVGNWADSDKSNTLAVSEGKVVKFNGTAVTYTANYNGSVLTFEAACEQDMNGKTTYTATLSQDGQTVVITATIYAGQDEYGDDDFRNITITLTPAEEEQPVQPAHSCVGTWTGKPRGSSKVSTLVINADGTYDLNGSSGAWTKKSDDEITFGMYTVNAKTKSVSIYDDDSMGDYPWSDVTFTPASSGSEPEEPALDAFAGKWTGSGYVLEFDGKGKVKVTTSHVTEQEVSYTVSGSTASLDFSGWTATLLSNGKLQVTDEDSNDYDLTKQA